jgi:hypothetical protein
MYPVGLASTRILTDYAQESPGTLSQSARYVLMQATVKTFLLTTYSQASGMSHGSMVLLLVRCALCRLSTEKWSLLLLQADDSSNGALDR